MDPKSLIFSWEYYLGERLLRFVLNKDTGPLDGLSAEQVEVLQFFESEEIYKAGYDPRLPSLLATVPPGRDMSVAWDLRQRCGGVVPESLGSDDVARGLARIARDVYCILLSPPDLIVGGKHGRSEPASDPLIALSQAIHTHPVGGDIEALLQGEAEAWEARTVETLMGRGGLDAAPTPDSVISAAARRWRHRLNADAPALMEETTSCLASLRHLADGKPISTPVFIGLQGLSLKGQEEHSLSFGLLRTPTEDEGRFAFFPGATSEVDAVLAVDNEVHPISDEDNEPLAMHMQIRVAGLARTSCVASALCTRNDDGPPSAASIAWITEAPPFGGVGAFRPGPFVERRTPPKTYSSDRVKEFAGWVEELDAVNQEHVSIAIDRLLRACNELEWGQGLIDAVVGWENLFGTKHETVYRVTGALAVLCENNPDLRLKKQKAFKKIYDSRSRLIHGDTAHVSSEMRDEAIQVGLEALARLVRDRPALLDLSESSLRADNLLLGLPDPS